MTVEIPEVVETKPATSVEMEEDDPTKKTSAMFDIYLPFLILIRPFFCPFILNFTINKFTITGVIPVCNDGKKKYFQKTEWTWNRVDKNRIIKYRVVK